MKIKGFWITVFSIGILLTAVTDSPGTSYYEGKTISIVVGFGPGGGYDRIARLLAKHLPKHIPGRPTIIVQNMVGGGSMIAASYLYNVARPDGLTIGTIEKGLAFAQLLKTDGVQFDLMKYSWIGSAASETVVLAIRSDLPYKTVDDLRKARDPLYIAGIGASDTQHPLILKEYLKLNLKMTIYPSAIDGMLAIERKEADGKSGSYSTLKPYIDRGLIRPLLRGRKSIPEIANLPVDQDLTTDPKGKTILGMLSSIDLFARLYVAPPGSPPEVINILRTAFARVMKDPELLADSKKMGYPMEYVSADECLKVLKSLFSQPDDIVKEFGKFVKF